MWTPKDEILVSGVRFKKEGPKPKPPDGPKPLHSPNPPKSAKYRDPYPPKSEIIPPEVGKRRAREFLDLLDGKKKGSQADEEVESELRRYEDEVCGLDLADWVHGSYLVEGSGRSVGDDGVVEPDAPKSVVLVVGDPEL